MAALPASAEDQSRAEAEAESQVRRFYEEHDLLTQPEGLRHYLNAPRPAYVEPLRWLGVTDDLTGPDRLDEDGVSYVPAPSPELPYFYRANAADPRAGIVHEGAHYQQLALAWRRPARPGGTSTIRAQTKASPFITKRCSRKRVCSTMPRSPAKLFTVSCGSGRCGSKSTCAWPSAS